MERCGEDIRHIEERERELCTALNKVKRERIEREKHQTSSLASNGSSGRIHVSPMRNVNKF